MDLLILRMYLGWGIRWFLGLLLVGCWLLLLFLGFYVEGYFYVVALVC